MLQLCYRKGASMACTLLRGVWEEMLRILCSLSATGILRMGILRMGIRGMLHSPNAWQNALFSSRAWEPGQLIRTVPGGCCQ